MYRGFGVQVDRHKSTLFCRVYRVAAHSAGKKETIVDETEQSIENQELEQAPPAGEAVKTEDKVIPEDKAVAKFTKLRQRAQDAEVRASRAEGVIEGMKQAAAKAAPPAVSPIDAEIARQVAEGVDAEDVTISAALYRKQKQYESQVANKESEAAASEALVTSQTESIAAARLKHDDWDDVVKLGEGHLTKGELVDIQAAGDNYALEAYVKCKAATDRAKPKPDNAAQNTSKQESKAELESAKKHVPTQDEILSVVGTVDPQIENAAAL